MKRDQPLVSVIVCTFNRAESLRETLSALARQRLPEDRPWELVVVDNNSTDATRAVVAEFSALSTVAIRYVFETRQGLSHARNRGIRESRGELLLFTDDDVRPAPDWLQTLSQSMLDHGCDGAGGWIGPLWEVPPPAWLTERFYGFLAIRTDEGDARRVQTSDDPPFGANMGFRRAVFDRIGDFDVELGRHGTATVGGEEWDLFQRLLAVGGKVMYFPAARVHHEIPRERIRKSYFRRWRFENSRHQARLHDVPGDRRILGIPPYLLLQTFDSIRRAIWARATAPADEGFHKEMLVCHFFGAIMGLLDRRRFPA